MAELVCNEIRLATNFSGTASEDILFYYKMLTKIIETCDLKIKEPDSSMKTKLTTLDASNTSACSNTTYQSETDSSDNEVVVINKNTSEKCKKKNQKPKHLQNTGPKLYTTPNLNKKTNKKNDNTKKHAPKIASNKTQNKNTSNVDQMKSKMSKFLNSPAVEPISSNNSNLLTTEALRNIQTQSEIENYTQQLYQNILTNTQQYNLHNIAASQNRNRFFNQNHTNLPTPIPPLFQNPQPPSLLSLRPQINQPGYQQSNCPGKKNFSSKKK